jgi:hypothetical protein
MTSLLDSPKFYTFDIESWPNFFSCVVKHRISGTRWIFEVSEWQNDAPAFIEFMRALQYHKCYLCGFNDFYYDWQVVEYLLAIGPTFTAADAYRKNDQIINGKREDNFKLMKWGNDHAVRQIDLYLIHHFDNFAKSTSLKETEFNMRSPNVGDLPFPFGEPIPFEGRRQALVYNCEDVDETEKFAEYSRPMIDFRAELIPTMGEDVLNYNDTKIGKKYFEQEIRNRAPHLLGSRGEKRQTPRSKIALSDVILPSLYDAFETPQMRNLLHRLNGATLTQTKAPPELKDLSVTLEGFEMVVGAGGGHGSVEKQCVRAGDGWSIMDVDVGGYYPDLAVKNGFYPEHLTPLFCEIYADVVAQRHKHKKKTAPNEMLKLAVNGVYGDSANPHSIFFDPQYTMQITINGQLLLYLLTEKILCHTNSKMVQLNTDGITFLVRDAERDMAMKICKWWEEFTGLVLEYADYEAMWIRDVNSYIAKSADGYVKRIGAYAHETQRENPATREIKWNKDHSALVVPKAAEAEMVHGVPVREFVMNHADPFDFMLRSKVTGKTRQRLMPAAAVDTPPRPETLDDGSVKHHIDGKGIRIDHVIFEPDAGVWLQKLTRYYIAKNGSPLQTVHKAAPAAAMRRKERVIGVNVGWPVAVCDDVRDFDPSNLDREWYIAEAEKLVIR